MAHQSGAHDAGWRWGLIEQREGQFALPGQHTGTVAGAASEREGGLEEGCRVAGVDEVVKDTFGGRGGVGESEILTFEPGGRSVNDQGGLGEHSAIVKGVDGAGFKLGGAAHLGETAGKGRGAWRGSIRDDDARRAQPDTCENGRGGSTASAGNQSGLAFDGNVEMAQVGLEAARVGIVAVERAVAIDYAVDGAQKPGFAGELREHAGGAFLMRDGQIHAEQGKRLDGTQGVAQLVRGDMKSRVGAVEGKCGVGRVVHRRREGMLDRIAVNCGEKRASA